MAARLRQALRLSGEASGGVLIVEVDVDALYPQYINKILRTRPDRRTRTPAGQGGRTKPWLKVGSVSRLGGRGDPAWPTENAGCPGIPPPAVSDGPPAYVARRSAPSPNQGQKRQKGRGMWVDNLAL